MAPQRKFALTRLAAGDYLLPSNDKTTIWRIRRYEDGPSHGLEDWPRDRQVWGVWKWRGVCWGGTVNERLFDDLDNPDQWDLVASTIDTRGEAIDEAMRRGEAQGDRS